MAARRTPRAVTASAEAVVAATDDDVGGPRAAPAMPGAILMAAILLPGVAPRAQAETAPDAGLASLRYLSYRDSQPGLDRITVHSPSLYVLKPIDAHWAIEG